MKREGEWKLPDAKVQSEAVVRSRAESRTAATSKIELYVIIVNGWKPWINDTKCSKVHLCQSLFFNKVAGLSPATFFKKRHWHRCFHMDFAKFLRTSFFTEKKLKKLKSFKVALSILCLSANNSNVCLLFLSQKYH